jgi:pyruvate dehydrogenase E1 component alpha subunit
MDKDDNEFVIGLLDSASQVASLPSGIDKTTALNIYKTMVLTRIFDSKVLSLQRQGRVGAYITSAGEEAAAVASSYALEKADWMFTSYRETGAHLARGMPLDLMLAQLYGNSNDLLKGRQMSNSWGSRELNTVTTAAPIGAYLPVAVGCSMAAKLKQDRVTVLTYLGDGGTSSSDFHTAMNFAGVFKAPIVFICRNNGWAISLPVSRQTASISIAIKARAYGFPGIRVDGNDALVMYTETRKALDSARAGGGPTFIEALTYRLGAHSTSDDPSRYRDEKDVELWEQKDPVKRLKRFLVSLKLWSEKEDEDLTTKFEQMLTATVERQEKLSPLTTSELFFDDVYSVMPWFLKEQKEELSSS